MTIIKSLYMLDLLGFFGPLIIGIINTFILWEQSVYLYGYLLFLILNSIINKSLKSIYRESRPIGGINFIDREVHYGADIYGMPSGHAQSTAYSLAYLYLVQKSNGILVANTLLLLLTTIQRWNYKKHTIEQLITGTVVGLICGWSSYYIVKRIAEHNYLFDE